MLVAARCNGMTSKPGDGVWFTEDGANQIGRITTQGVFSEFPIPTPGSNPLGIALTSDGTVWFTENAANKIGRFPSG